MVSLMATPMDTFPTTMETGSTMDTSFPFYLTVMVMEASVATEEGALVGTLGDLEATEEAFWTTNK